MTSIEDLPPLLRQCVQQAIRCYEDFERMAYEQSATEEEWEALDTAQSAVLHNLAIAAQQELGDPPGVPWQGITLL